MSPWPYLSRSYICILPSSLTRILPCAFAFSARPPVSVYGTVPRRLKLRKCFSARRLVALPLPVGRVPPGFPPSTHLTVDIVGSPLRPGLPSPGCDSPYASFHRICGRHGNVDPFPIGYDLRPRLRGRLTPGQIAFCAEVSVVCLAPLNCRRTTTRPVSCYALFEGMAASEPTSWLSVQSHFLSHLAHLWDLDCRSGLFPSRRRPLSVAV